MIEFNSKNETVQSSVVPDELPIALVVERTAGELDRVSLLVRELEDDLLNARQVGLILDMLVAQQSIDMIQQSVDVLADFLKNLAKQCGSWDVPVSTSLPQVSLGAMRERLICGTKSELDQVDSGGINC